MEKEILLFDAGNRYAGFFSYFIQIMYNTYKADLYNLDFHINLTHDMLFLDKNITHTNNVWEYYFSQPLKHSDIKENSKILGLDTLYIDDDFNGLMNYNIKYKLHDIFFKYYKLLPNIENIINTFYDNNFKNNKVIAIHKRGTDHIKDGEILDCEYYIRKLNEELLLNDYDKIFLCTDEIQTVEYFRNIFNDKLITYDSIRTSDNIGIHYGVGLENPYKMGEDIVVETFLMAKCDFLIKSQSNISSAVSILNPNQKTRYIDLHVDYNRK